MIQTAKTMNNRLDFLQLDRNLFLQVAKIEGSRPKPNRRHLINCAKSFGRALERDVQQVLNGQRAECTVNASAQWK